MSGQIRIDIAQRLRGASLAERLTAIGISVPDQPEAHRMKHAMLLGLPPESSNLRIRFAYFRKLVTAMNATFYISIEFDKFCDETWRNFGGYPPETVHTTVAKVRQFLPDIELDVHATFDDPWLVARDTHGMVILHGWYRAHREANPVLLL